MIQAALKQQLPVDVTRILLPPFHDSYAFPFNASTPCFSTCTASVYICRMRPFHARNFQEVSTNKFPQSVRRFFFFLFSFENFFLNDSPLLLYFLARTISANRNLMEINIDKIELRVEDPLSSDKRRQNCLSCHAKPPTFDFLPFHARQIIIGKRRRRFARIICHETFLLAGIRFEAA